MVTFSEQFHKTLNIYKLIVIIEEIIFILHVANGIHIIIHNGDSILTQIRIRILLFLFIYKYKYFLTSPIQIRKKKNYSYTCTNKHNFNHHFRKRYHGIAFFKTFSTIYNTS